MIAVAPRPILRRLSAPVRRPAQRIQGKLMTLAAAFRGPKGGILLCSDQEWNDAGVSKRQINKNYHIGGLKSCELFMSGAGLDTAVITAWTEIHECLNQAEMNGSDIFADHRYLIESTLKSVCKKFAKDLKLWPMSLLVVVAPRDLGKFPILYRTTDDKLVHEPFYYAVGTGKTIADYLADRLFDPPWRSNKRELAIVAAFILRESGDSSPGVGMGANMVFIHEGEKAMHYISPGIIKEMQDGIPSLADATHSYWPGRLHFPDWYAS